MFSTLTKVFPGGIQFRQAGSCNTGNKDFEADFKTLWDFCSNPIGIPIENVFFPLEIQNI